MPDPLSTFRAISHRPYSFFLDSALKNRKFGRFSFLGCDPFLVFKSKRNSVVLEWRNGKKETFKANPFAALKDIFEKYRRPCHSRPRFRGGKLRGNPFTSGGVGYFSYDLKDFTEKLPDIAVDDLGLSDCVMGFYDKVIAWENRDRHLFSCLPNPGKIGVCPYFPTGLRSNFTKSAYIKAIKKAKQYIKAGDIYQVNLSQRFEAPCVEDPAELYLKLRMASPAPFGAYLGFPDATILSSSPERFLLKNGNYIETRPIKGTRPRGYDRQSDRLMAKALRNSAKDNAEHIMIVDLERNDLGKVCDYGTVRQSESAVMEKYSNVFHLVSTVSGRIRKGLGPIDCLSAVFPGGSITGAPKVRSMEIIEELEPVKRSIYTGAIGYISFDGNMDLSIAIRTMILKNGRAYFSVGGGIVADSDPDAEYQETLDKAAGIFRTLGAVSVR